MNLYRGHLRDLRLSGLSDETINAAGLYTVQKADFPEKLNRPVQGILTVLAFPYRDCDGFERFKVSWEKGFEGKKPKYVQPSGTQNHLYLPPTVDLEGDTPLLIVEGEKKTLAVWQAGFQVVGIGGIWNWCEKGDGYNGAKEPRLIPDFDRVNCKRPVTIVFDSDGYENYSVRLAAYRLARLLSKRGAKVSIVFIPLTEVPA